MHTCQIPIKENKEIVKPYNVVHLREQRQNKCREKLRKHRRRRDTHAISWLLQVWSGPWTGFVLPGHLLEGGNPRLYPRAPDSESEP